MRTNYRDNSYSPDFLVFNLFQDHFKYNVLKYGSVIHYFKTVLKIFFFLNLNIKKSTAYRPHSCTFEELLPNAFSRGKIKIKLTTKTY